MESNFSFSNRTINMLYTIVVGLCVMLEVFFKFIICIC